MATRPELNGTSAPTGNANGVDTRSQTFANGTRSREEAVNGNADNDQRPSSAPGRRNGGPLETRDDIESQRSRRPNKPPLLRSKSEFAHRARDEADQVEEDIPEWGARHGFEDHYQSEDIISQLANVSGIFDCSSFCVMPLVFLHSDSLAGRSLLCGMLFALLGCDSFIIRLSPLQGI